MGIYKILLFGVVSYVSNNGPGSLSKWQGRSLKEKPKRKREPAVHERHGMIIAISHLDKTRNHTI